MLTCNAYVKKKTEAISGNGTSRNKLFISSCVRNIK